VSFLEIGPITHRAAVVGRAVDARTREPLSGVRVAITSGPPAWLARLAVLREGRPATVADMIVTTSEGRFRWLDLPAGAYTLTATPSDPRYAPANGTATVAAAPAVIELALAPTALTGIVEGGSPPARLGMARVRFADGAEATHTAEDGTFTLSPVEPGTKRVLEITAARHRAATIVVALQHGVTTAAAPITLSLS
jgi:hypothetical protein